MADVNDAASVISGGDPTVQFGDVAPMVIPKQEIPGMIAVFMTTKTGSWALADGKVFTPDKPYQLMMITEARTLINNNPERFREATKEEVKAFYKIA